MKVVIAVRNGVEKLRIPAELKNGVLRNGKNILINADLIPAGQRDRVVATIKSGKISSEIEAMGMRIGDNGNGLIVRWMDDIEAERRAADQAAYGALPADVRAVKEDRQTIDDMYERAGRALNNDTDDNNVSRGYSLRAEADARLKAWKIKYPKQAMFEQAADLDAKAMREDDLACGALVYDADGLLSASEQQQMHDEHKAKATEYRARANALRAALMHQD